MSDSFMRPSKRRWVAGVQSTSNAMDLEPGVFRKKSAEAIAKSVLRSVKRSRRRKGTILSSGISMLTYYANRGGRNLSSTQKKKIQAAKNKYRKLAG
jgi:hypothetical protein